MSIRTAAYVPSGKVVADYMIFMDSIAAEVVKENKCPEEVAALVAVEVVKILLSESIAQLGMEKETEEESLN